MCPSSLDNITIRLPIVICIRIATHLLYILYNYIRLVDHMHIASSYSYVSTVSALCVVLVMLHVAFYMA